MEMEHNPFPAAVEIQTTSACNAKCLICPHPQVARELPSGAMGMELFCKIIDQIDPAWRCRIIPYLNNEPFCDRLIVERLRYITARLGAAEIELSTNVSLLDQPKQQELVGIRLKELRLSVFGFTERTHSRIMPGLRWQTVEKNLDAMAGNLPFRRLVERIAVVMVNHPLVTPEDIGLAREYCLAHALQFNLWGFLDRAKNVAGYSNGVCRPFISGCEQNRPLERMHITFAGDVILCCQDWRRRNIIGNLRQRSLLDIWNSDAYNQYRNDIYAGCGQQPIICTNCKLAKPVT